MEKINLSCGHPQDNEIILHSPFRRQIATIAKLKIKAEIKLQKNEIMVRTKSMCPLSSLAAHEWCSSKARINDTIAHTTAIFGFAPAGLVVQDVERKAV